MWYLYPKTLNLSITWHVTRVGKFWFNVAPFFEHIPTTRRKYRAGSFQQTTMWQNFCFGLSHEKFRADNNPKADLYGDDTAPHTNNPRGVPAEQEGRRTQVGWHKTARRRMHFAGIYAGRHRKIMCNNLPQCYTEERYYGEAKSINVAIPHCGLVVVFLLAVLWYALDCVVDVRACGSFGGGWSEQEKLQVLFLLRPHIVSVTNTGNEIAQRDDQGRKRIWPKLRT